MTDHEQPAAGVALAEAIDRLDRATTKPRVSSDVTVDAVDLGLVLEALRAPTDAGGAVSEADVERLCAAMQDGVGCTPWDNPSWDRDGGSSRQGVRDAVRRILAALTPAPQAEGNGDCGCGLGDKCPDPPQPLQQGGEVTREQVARLLCAQDGHDPDQHIIGGQASNFEDFGPRWKAARNGAWHGFHDYEEDADAILAIFASPDLGDLAGLVERLEKTDLVDNSHGGGKTVRRNPDGPEAARALRSLAADRDKAVGLLRGMVDEKTRRYHNHVESEETTAARAFLSSQTEGR